VRPVVIRPGEEGPAGEPCTGLVIATPTYGGIAAGYVGSLLATQDLLRREGVPVGVMFVSGDSLVQRGRNKLVAEFMTGPASHLLFIDADIEWKPQDVLRLIGHGRDMICGAYPKKQFPPVFALLPRLDAEGRSRRDPRTGAVEIEAAATGFLMIRRQVFARMMQAYPELRYQAYRSDGISEAAREFTYSLFECITTAGAYYSEDYGFCLRWRHIGGDVWVDPAIELVHHGMHGYRCDPRTMFSDAPRAEAPPADDDAAFRGSLAATLAASAAAAAE
jgi:hypothetical protein